MRVAVTGSTGFLGTALANALESRGDEVVRFVRPTTTSVAGTSVRWDPATGDVDDGDLRRVGGLDAAVNLAGVGIASRRWSPAYRTSVKTSRTGSTALLVSALATLPSGVATLVSGSAIGFYGERGDEVLDESSSSGSDYVSEVCREWEAAAEGVRSTGARLVLARTGIVFGPGGGIWERLAPLFRVGLGGVIGTGRQWTSPIALRDAIDAFLWLLDHPFEGPVNLVAPTPCTNREMTRALAAACHRPALARVPAFAIRAALGRELADNTALVSQRVVPRVLNESGFSPRARDMTAIAASLVARPSVS